MLMRTPTEKIVKQIVKVLQDEHPDYIYLRDLFKKIRKEFDIEVSITPKRLPYIPTEEDLRKYYEIVYQAKEIKHMILIRLLIYTGVRVHELVNIKIKDIDFDGCQIQIKEARGAKDRIVPFPESFKDTLKLYVQEALRESAIYLFESNRRTAYTTRGIRNILANYAAEAGMKESLSPQKLRHFLFSWLKQQGIDDEFIQPYSGHETKKSLEIYPKIRFSDAQKVYNKTIRNLPI